MKKNVIVYTIDRNAEIDCGVSIYSLLRNNKNIQIYIFVQGKLKEPEKFKQLEKQFNTKIIIKQIDTAMLDDFANKYKSKHWSPIIYARLIIPDLLPTNLDKVLFMDADTVINGSLTRLFQYNINPFVLAAVRDTYYNKKNTRETKINPKCAFNSGVMYLNLKRIRKEKLFKNMLVEANKCKMFKFIKHEQELLNIFFQEQTLFIPAKYNLFYAPYHNMKRHNLKKGVILHFAGMIKAKYFECISPFRKTFLWYLKQSPWKEYTPKPSLAGYFLRLYHWINVVIHRTGLQPFFSKLFGEQFSKNIIAKFRKENW